MDRRRLGPLDVRQIVKGVRREGDAPEAREKPLTIVLMHGFGAPGDDLLTLAESIDVPLGTTFIFPEAIHALSDLLPMFGDARAWWLIDFERLERAMHGGALSDLAKEIPEGIEEARAAVIEMLDDLAKEQPLDRLVLGGFSQGAMLALDVALRTSRPLVGAILLSGTVIAEEEWRPLLAKRAGLPVFQSHGTEDAILPYAGAERLRDLLGEAGLKVTFERFVGPHAIPPNVLRKVSSWIGSLTA
jgi:phospholipase/carboxylesterase